MIEYNLTDHCVHHFVFKAATRQAVDKFIQIRRQILLDQGEDQPHYSLIDFAGNTPPILYATKQMRLLYKRISPPKHLVIAYVYQNDTYINIIRSLINGLNVNMARHFFHKEEEDAAWKWLHEEIDKLNSSLG